MLKEYIINLMDVNQEEMGRYVEKLKKLQQEYRTGQEWIVNLQKENDLEQNIFSPRIAAAGGLEKLAQAQEKQQAIEYYKNLPFQYERKRDRGSKKTAW